MEKIVVTSMWPSAGKTTAIIGIAKALNLKFGYMKPFGERLLYRKKRLWDYDAALIAGIFGLEENAEDMSIGFHHPKLLYMLDEETTGKRLLQQLAHIGEKKDFVFIEAAKDITYGTSVYLDALSLAKYLDARLLVIAAGEGSAVDGITFLHKRIRMEEVNLLGVIFNKVTNVAEFTDYYTPKIKKLNMNVLGIIPYNQELPFFSVRYVVDRLLAKVIAGETCLHRLVKNIFVGSASPSALSKHPGFEAGDKMVITSGDRADMILAALDSHSAAVVLTNNILPPANLVAKAEEMGIPLLLVPFDTYQVAKQMDNLEPLPTKDDQDKIALVERMITTHVNLNELKAEK
jgi:BioD-like phosphotransacetylase family protein